MPSHAARNKVCVHGVHVHIAQECDDGITCSRTFFNFVLVQKVSFDVCNYLLIGIFLAECYIGGRSEYTHGAVWMSICPPAKFTEKMDWSVLAAS